MKVHDTPEAVRSTLERWVRQNSAIGIFENKDLSHSQVGRRVAFPYEPDVLAGAEIGKARAPDTTVYGLGWRYVLIAKPTSVGEALSILGLED